MYSHEEIFNVRKDIKICKIQLKRRGNVQEKRGLNVISLTPKWGDKEELCFCPSMISVYGESG